MFGSLPSLPRLPTQVPGLSQAPTAVLNALSRIAEALPGLNPATPIYAIINADTGIPLTIPDSWGEIVVRWADYQTTEYPVEGGGFITANKVRKPMGVDMVLIKTGSDATRFAWLEAIRQQLESNKLARYHIITPNGVFQSLTLTAGAFQTRQDRGQNMLYLEIKAVEVPQIRESSLLGQRAVNPESGPLADAGRVYPETTPPVDAALAGAPVDV